MALRNFKVEDSGVTGTFDPVFGRPVFWTRKPWQKSGDIHLSGIEQSELIDRYYREVKRSFGYWKHLFNHYWVNRKYYWAHRYHLRSL
jgi:hypothetical protein